MANTLINLKANENIYSACLGAEVIGSDIVFTTDIEYKDSLFLNLYDKDENLICNVDMTDFKVNRNLCSVVVTDKSKAVCAYNFESDGVLYVDPYRRNDFKKQEWGKSTSNDKSEFYVNSFDWDGDRCPCIDNSDVISYLVNVRGLTMVDKSIPKNHRGTYKGIADKISYFSELGINQLILMPAYDFDEVITPEGFDSAVPARGYSSDKYPQVNLWGYTSGAFYMPKGAYAVENAVTEFKEMVYKLHAAGIEVIMQFYFADDFSRYLCARVLNFWALEYHVDGFYVLGIDIPSDILAQDIYLSDRKLIFEPHNLDKAINSRCKVVDNISFLNNDFSTVMRRFLKSDEDTLKDFLNQMRLNPRNVYTLNYITTNAGFTLNDLVSFDYKHNENNFEDNRDGSDYNYSWNCGVEGPTRKKNIVALRKRQIKNILIMLLLSQGTPLILAGDEWLNTQEGNNNAYCQDNEIGWTEWKKGRDNLEIFEFVKSLIKLRHEHPIIHTNNEYQIMGAASCGYPDISYHSDEAWRPRLDNYLRHIGIMLCGKYVNVNGQPDDFFYFAFNMHWEHHRLALPKLPVGYSWNLELFTGDEEEKKLMENGMQTDKDFVDVPFRSVAILRSVMTDNGGK